MKTWVKLDVLQHGQLNDGDQANSAALLNSEIAELDLELTKLVMVFTQKFLRKPRNISRNIELLNDS